MLKKIVREELNKYGLLKNRFYFAIITVTFSLYVNL